MLFRSDIFDDIADEKFHIVVSNPPYIERDAISSLQTEVSVYEPKIALDGGTDGLDYYRRIVELFKNIHEKNGVLAVEIGWSQRISVEEIFMNAKLFKEIKSCKDLSGRDRVVCGFL